MKVRSLCFSYRAKIAPIGENGGVPDVAYSKYNLGLICEFGQSIEADPERVFDLWQIYIRWKP